MNNTLWAANPTAAAEYCRRHLPQNVELTLALAEDILENRFTFRDHWEMERTTAPVGFSQEINWSHIPADDPEWLYAMNRHTSFINLGKAYRYTGDEKYPRKFAQLIDGWIDRVPLDNSTRGREWRSLEAGLRCENWLRTLRLLEDSPALTPALLEKIRDCLTVHGEYLCRESGDFHRMSNWGVMQDHGLFLLGVWMEREDWRGLAIGRMEEQLRLQVFDDGSHWEQSPMYHCEVLHCAMDAVHIALQNHLPLPEGLTTRVHSMCAALAKWITPTGRLVRQSDSDDTDARDLLIQGALLFGDGSLRFAGGDALFEETLWDFGPEAVERYRAIPPCPPRHPSTVLPDSGNYMLRGDLTPDAAFLHLHCGCLGSGHGHADLLHIDLTAYGEDVLMDSGRYTYVNTPLRRALKLPGAHNTTRVDGLDFSECVDSWGYSQLAQPLKGEYKFTPEADYVSGGHMGYLGMEGGGVLVTRQVVFLRPGLFIITDSFFTQGEHTYERSFHLGEGEAALEGDILRWQGQRAGLTLCCMDANGCALSRAPYSRNYNTLCQGDKLTVTAAGRGTTHLVTVAVVGERGRMPEVQAQRLPVTTTRLGRAIGPELAHAVRVTLDGVEYLALFCHGEVISEVDLLSAAGRDGYGKVIVFTPAHPRGVTLRW